MIISITNQKGGVGKTTTALNLGAALGLLGYPVLLVDVDPQAHLTKWIAKVSAKYDISHVLTRKVHIQEAIIKHNSLLHYLPGSPNIMAIETGNRIGREMLLRTAIAGIPPNKYSCILIDCPPNLGVLTANALVASDYVIIPTLTEYMSQSGIQETINAIQEIEDSGINKNLSLLGILIANHDQRRKISNAIAEGLSKKMPVFNTRIHVDVSMIEASAMHETIFEYKHDARSAIEYLALAQEII